ncbi:uncharacterized protein METZ01_LOCUS490653, partial [marine metagenome]
RMLMYELTYSEKYSKIDSHCLYAIYA